jgi:hypothetical protein
MNQALRLLLCILAAGLAACLAAAAQVVSGLAYSNMVVLLMSLVAFFLAFTSAGRSKHGPPWC